MRVSELIGKRIVIWGAGQEGLAARKYISERIPGQTSIVVDENPKLGSSDKSIILTAPDAVRQALESADVIVKSPGVSLYHPMLVSLQARHTKITSLLNLWFSNERAGQTIAVTGTKGKSTTSTLLGHTLRGIGKRATVLGNIGIPVTEAPQSDLEYTVIEVSSYQAADFSGECDVGVLTSLFEEHLDWHKSARAYFRDKANLLRHAQVRLVEAAACQVLIENRIDVADVIKFNSPDLFRFDEGGVAFSSGAAIGRLRNRYLLRQHNLNNVLAVLSVIDQLGLDLQHALHAMESYRGLPHRQQELGELQGVLFVDDSISTIPQSAIAALQAYCDRPQTLIAGGFDRGVDHTPLVRFIRQSKTVQAVVCLGPSGMRLLGELKALGFDKVSHAQSMEEAVLLAKQQTPAGGAILLSPAAPSFGMFKDYIERAEAFVRACGFS
jgi:UDP-N-acetylmuramoyl-L-alanine---L-glutamate ligase